MDREPGHITAAEIAFRRTCAWWKERILKAGGTEAMYYEALDSVGLKHSSHWCDGEDDTQKRAIRALQDAYQDAVAESTTGGTDGI